MTFSRGMGDYKTHGYAGDPSFLSGLWNIAKPIIAGTIGGYLTQIGGGGAQPGIEPRVGMGTPPILPRAGGGAMVPYGGVTFPGGTSIIGGLVPGQGRLPPFTATGPGVLPGGGRGGAGGCPSGYHFAKDGSGRLVRNRRMNIANPRALRRAMRRVQGFEKLARRTITFTRRVKMKKGRSS